MRGLSFGKTADYKVMCQRAIRDAPLVFTVLGNFARKGQISATLILGDSALHHFQPSIDHETHHLPGRVIAGIVHTLMGGRVQGS